MPMRLISVCFILAGIIACNKSKIPDNDKRISIFDYDSFVSLDQNIARIKNQEQKNNDQYLSHSYYDSNSEVFHYSGGVDKIESIKLGGADFSFFKTDNSLVRYKDQIVVLDDILNVWVVSSDLKTKEQIFKTDNKLSDFASLTIYEDFLIRSDSIGNIVKIDLRNFNIVAKVHDPRYKFYSGFSFAKDSNLLYGHASSGVIFAFNIDDLSVKFSISDGSNDQNGIANLSSEKYINFARPTVKCDKLIVINRYGDILFLDKISGKIIDSNRLDFISGRSILYSTQLSFDTPMFKPFVNDIVGYFGSKISNIAVFSMKNIMPVYSTKFNQNSPIISSANFLYFITNQNQLLAVHIESGMVKWSLDLPKYHDHKMPKYLSKGKGYNRSKLNFRGPMFINGDIALFSPFGKMLIIDIEGGEIKEEKSIPSCIFSTPVVMDDAIFGYSLCDSKLYKMH